MKPKHFTQHDQRKWVELSGVNLSFLGFDPTGAFREGHVEITALIEAT